jgi:redox-sensitive bicupin YhaK (pirin superfamily)
MHALTQRQMNPAFRAAILTPGPLALGHYLRVVHFHMAQPTFPPHPHAGFSAVTWMLPWSPGGFVNRDTLGETTRIGPGALHWNLAGAGMVHEEIPEEPGVDCEGLQIFVKLPEALESAPPAAYHLDADEVPVDRVDGAVVRVLAGRHGDAVSPVPCHAQTSLLHVDVDGDTTLTVPDGVQAFAMCVRGEGHVAGRPLSVHHAAELAPGPVAMTGRLSVVVGFSEPMPRVPTFAGPFCVFDPARLAEVHHAYTSGAMGRLTPSPVRWMR